MGLHVIALCTEVYLPRSSMSTKSRLRILRKPAREDSGERYGVHSWVRKWLRQTDGQADRQTRLWPLTLVAKGTSEATGALCLPSGAFEGW